jgi:transposase
MPLKKYLSTEEQEEVKKLYKTGKYSYPQLAERFLVGRGTIINTIKNYPYNQDKQAVYSRLQQESKANLDESITKENKKAQEACKRGNMLAYTMHLEHLKELYQFQTQDLIYEPLKQHRLTYEQSAWDAFSQGDYINFAFAADMWELLTEVIGDMAKSPFKRVIQNSGAGRLSRSVRYSNVRGHVPNKTQNKVYTSITKDSWKLIEPILKEHNPCRDIKYKGDKIYFEAIYFMIANAASYRMAASKYNLNFRKICIRFETWFKKEVFKDLIQLCNVCPEIQAIEDRLIKLEQIRHGKGKLPRIKDL